MINHIPPVKLSLSHHSTQRSPFKSRILFQVILLIKNCSKLSKFTMRKENLKGSWLSQDGNTRLLHEGKMAGPSPEIRGSSPHRSHLGDLLPLLMWLTGELPPRKNGRGLVPDTVFLIHQDGHFVLGRHLLLQEAQSLHHVPLLYWWCFNSK